MSLFLSIKLKIKLKIDKIIGKCKYEIIENNFIYNPSSINEFLMNEELTFPTMGFQYVFFSIYQESKALWYVVYLFVYICFHQ